jgi:hypothetical protein
MVIFQKMEQGFSGSKKDPHLSYWKRGDGCLIKRISENRLIHDNMGDDFFVSKSDF